MVRQPHPEEVVIHFHYLPAARCLMDSLSPSELQECAKGDFHSLPVADSAFQLLTAVIIPSPRRQLPPSMPRGHHPF